MSHAAGGRRALGRLSVRVDAPPRPALLRPAIEALIAGRAVSPGPERAVAEAVAAALAGRPPGPGREAP